MLKYLKQIKKLAFKLLIIFDLIIFAIQPNFIVKCIVLSFNIFIISWFLKFYDMIGILMTNNLEFYYFYCLALNYF